MPLPRGTDGEPSPNGLRRIGVDLGVQHDRSEATVAPISFQPSGRVMPQGWDSVCEDHTMGFGKDGKGTIIREQRSQAIGTLAARTALIIGTKIALLERFRIIKCEAIALIRNRTSGEQNGMQLYLVDGNFSLAEIQGALDNIGPAGPNDAAEEAISERFIKWIGSTPTSVGTEPTQFLNEKGGGHLENTIRWTFARTKSWNWVLFNFGEAPTTGAVVEIQAKQFGVWVM